MPDTQSIIEEIIRLSGREMKRQGDVNAAEYAAQARISKVMARSDLQSFVDRGMMTSHLVYSPESNRRERVWRFKESPGPLT